MGRLIKIPTSTGSVEGYLAVPKGSEGPGVVVVQEWWGLNDQIMGVAKRLAAEGFTALAPDFYHGQGCEIGEPDEAGKLMMALNIQGAANDGRASAEYLAEQTGGKVGVIGFCMGGQLAMFIGTLAPNQVGAVVNMYGIHPNVKPDYSNMQAPVLALFGGEDGSNPPEARDGLAKELEQARVDYTMDVYEKADHAFMNEQRPEVYREADAEDAWGRILEFFRANLNA
jgi:carboxymethylenebutenolidase